MPDMLKCYLTQSQYDIAVLILWFAGTLILNSLLGGIIHFWGWICKKR